MEILRRAFTEDTYSDFVTKPDTCGFSNIRLCRRQFFRFFDIPKDTKKFWLSLHTTPSSNRHQVEIIKKRENGRDLYWYNTTRNFVCITKHIKIDVSSGVGFKKLVGKKLYLQCEY